MVRCNKVLIHFGSHLCLIQFYTRFFNNIIMNVLFTQRTTSLVPSIRDTFKMFRVDSVGDKSSLCHFCMLAGVCNILSCISGCAKNCNDSSYM